MTVASPPLAPSENMTRSVIRRAAQLLTGILIYALILFACAGTLDWPAAWYFLGLNLVMVALGGALLLRRRPDVVVARSHIRSDVETWDKWVSVFASLCMFVDLAVPALDLRFGWTSGFPLAPQLLGYFAIIAGYAVMVWAMLNNPFFEAGVRIQTDRGQSVATSGPYRIVRHPGYVGMILQIIGIPLALCSWWGLLAAVLGIGAFVLRTALEDRTLRTRLPGYSEFTTRVRYRLLPGIW